jgi:ABC-type antimicrobial peptide transport system permease subunit
MMKRNKEYGIKKVFGLQKWPLFVQIWTENVILAFWALMFAWLIVEITQVPVARLMDTEMHYTWFDLQLSLGFLFGMPVLTSIYPYIRYQYMSPITSMRAIATDRQSIITRMAFLCIQYMVTFVLVVFSLYLNSHFRFLINTPPGFRTESILEAPIVESGFSVVVGEDITETVKRHNAHLEAIVRKMDECPDILAWTNSENILVEREFKMTIYNDKDEATECVRIYADEKFFQVYDLKIVEGQLPEEIGVIPRTAAILNQAAMKALGYKHLDEAFIRTDGGMGGVVDGNGNITEFGKTLFPVTAVVEDYYSGHITEGVKPIIIQPGSIPGNKTLVHIAKGKEKEVLEYLKNAVREVYGKDELEYSWMEDQVKTIYDEDRRVATIYIIFALIAIGIACLGLFGISLFDIRRRYREIAIRKAHGAGMKDLYQLLFKKYLAVLGVSFVIATPIAYYAIYQYTADYVVKAPVGIGIFVLALLLVTAISMGTLYWQIRKAANIDPATVMKTE